MAGSGAVEAEMELVERERTQQEQAELPATSNETIDDAEFNFVAIRRSAGAANGFGSPVGLRDREDLDNLSPRFEQGDSQVQGRRVGTNPSNDIPSTDNFRASLTEQNYGGFDNDSQHPWEETSFTKYLIKTGILILLWYALSSALAYYNKKLLGNEKDNGLAFPAPILMTAIHFTIQAVVSTIIVRRIPSMRPSVQLTWSDYCMRVYPTAIATALEISLSAMSLRSLTVTIETMCKSSAPVFLLIFAFLFKVEVPSLKLVAIILISSAGVLLTIVEEKDSKATGFNLKGFILVMSAAVMSGFRWTVTQFLLHKREYGLNNPFAAMSVLTPIMAGVSFFLSFFWDSWKELVGSTYFGSPMNSLIYSAVILLGGSIAFFMVSIEFILVSVTSAVTLTVAGMFKEVVTIGGAILLFRERFTRWNGISLLIITIGVSLYNVYKYKKLRGHVDQHNYVAIQDAYDQPVPELGEDFNGGSA